MVAHHDAGDVPADLDDLAGRFVAEWHPAGVRRQPAHRDVQRIRPADAARLHLHQHVGRSRGRVGNLEDFGLARAGHHRHPHPRTPRIVALAQKHFAPGWPRLAIDTGRRQPYRDRHGKPRPRPADGDRSIPVTGPLDGRRAVVTGAATGLGAAAVRALSAAGARVVATYHQTEPDDGAGAAWLQCDARDAAAVDAMMDAAVTRLGGLDVLVNAAGLWQQGVPGTITAADIDFLIGTNLKTTIFTNQAAHAVMRRTGGRIINFGSAEAVMGSPISAVYAAAKGRGAGLDPLGGQGLGIGQRHGQRAGAGHADPGRRAAAGVPRPRRRPAHRSADQGQHSARRCAR